MQIPMHSIVKLPVMAAHIANRSLYGPTFAL